jgi:hypothetical protein
VQTAPRHDTRRGHLPKPGPNAAAARGNGMDPDAVMTIRPYYNKIREKCKYKKRKYNYRMRKRYGDTKDIVYIPAK